MESLRWNSVVCGHHVYKDIWTSFVGEILQEDDNPEDCFTVCIVKGLIHFLHFHSTIYKLPAFLLWCNFALCWATCAYQPWLITRNAYALNK